MASELKKNMSMYGRGKSGFQKVMESINPDALVMCPYCKKRVRTADMDDHYAEYHMGGM